MNKFIITLALSVASLVFIGCSDEGGGNNKNRTTVGTAAQCATAQYDQRSGQWIDRNGRRINCHNRGNNVCSTNYNRGVFNGQHSNMNNHLCNNLGNNIWSGNGNCGYNSYPVQIGGGFYCANAQFFSPFGMTPNRGYTYRFYYPNPYYWGVWHNGHYRFSDDDDNRLGWALTGALAGAAIGYTLAN